MRPLLQHASRELVANKIAPSLRLFSRHAGSTSSSCLACQQRTVFGGALRWDARLPLSVDVATTWPRRAFSSSTRWREEGGKPSRPSDPIPMPPPAAQSQPTPQRRPNVSAAPPSPEDQERLQRRLNALLEDQIAIQRAAESSVAALKEPPATEAPTPHPPPPEPEPEPPKKDESQDTIARVPDEQLPSHRERQRWSILKRFSDAMDELLPKLAVVTQKVNTYTGTDYSGVEALRREIKEQGM